MANGILVDEVTYFNNNTIYTGDSGSETNMYIIEDCYDFITMLDESKNNSYFKLVNDIDFNEHSTYKRGFAGSLVFNTGNSLYGDNHIIKNMVVSGLTSQPICFKKLVNCNFANIVAINCDWIPIGVNDAERCNFGMTLIDSCLDFRYGSNNYLTATDCTFNVKGILKGNLIFQKIIANQCQFNLDVTMNEEYIFHQGDFSNSNRFVSCYITGKIKNLYDGTVTWKTRQFNPTNSYFAFEYEQPLVEVIEAETTNGFNNFIDGELFSKNGIAITSDTDAFKILTTEQAKSVEYLNYSIGFITNSEVT